MALKYVILLVCIGMTWAQSEPSVSDAINQLPPELQGKVDEKQIADIQNKSTQIFKKKCEENGGPEAFQNTEKAFKEFTDCLKALVDPNKLQQEIEDAKPTGQVDEVFKKYCDKTPKFKSCFRNMTAAIKPCFSTEEQNNLKTVYNITEQLAEFVCFKEGDRIALFIAENGPECIKEKQEAIQECVNKTLGSDINFDQENFSMDNIPKIKFEDKECNQFAELQTCVVTALETCSAPTSANIVESLFKFVRRATPCKPIPAKDDANPSSRNGDATEQKQGNSATRFAATSFAMGATILALIA